MNSLHASNLCSHGALMDPRYLSDAMSSHPSEDRKAEILVRASLILAVCIPVLVWISGLGA